MFIDDQATLKVVSSNQVDLKLNWNCIQFEFDKETINLIQKQTSFLEKHPLEATKCLLYSSFASHFKSMKLH